MKNFPTLLKAQFDLINNKIAENGQANVLLLDTETTGLEPPIEITEFGGVVVEITKDEDGNFVTTHKQDLEKKYSPTKRIEDFATGLTKLIRPEENTPENIRTSYGAFITRKVNRTLTSLSELNQTHKAAFISELYKFSPPLKQTHPELSKLPLSDIKDIFLNHVCTTEAPTVLTPNEYPPYNKEEMVNILAEHKIDLCVAHNSEYDFSVLRNTYDFEHDPIIEYDTQSYGFYADKDNLSGAYRSKVGKSLNNLAKKISALPPIKKQQLSELIKSRDVKHTALLDVQVMVFLFEEQLELMQRGYGVLPSPKKITPAAAANQSREYKEGDVLVTSSQISRTNQLKYKDIAEYAKEKKLSGVFLVENIPTDIPTAQKVFAEIGVPLLLGLTVTARDTKQKVDILIDSTKNLRLITPISRGMEINSIGDLDELGIKYQAHEEVRKPEYLKKSHKSVFFIGNQLRDNTKTTKMEINFFDKVSDNNSLESGKFPINPQNQEQLKQVLSENNPVDLFWQNEAVVSAFPSWRVLETFVDNGLSDSQKILSNMSSQIAEGTLPYTEEKETNYDLAEKTMKARVLAVVESEKFKEEQYQKYKNQSVVMGLDDLYNFTSDTTEEEKKQIISATDIERVHREFVDIKAMNNPDYLKYFLYKEGLIKVSPVVGPARGSAAGSIIALALGITKLHPVQNKLLFSRFINKFRKEMPDIDTDFGNNALSMKNMGTVFNALQKAYHSKTQHLSPLLKSLELNPEQEALVLKYVSIDPIYTSRLSNIVSTSDRTVLLGLCRILSAPNFITQSITAEYDESIPLQDNISQISTSKELQTFVYEHMDVLQGLRLNSGVHAGGFIAPHENLSYLSFIQNNGVLYCTKEYAEDYDLIKMDILGNLSVQILKEVSQQTNTDYVDEPYAVASFNDGKVFYDMGELLNTVSTAQSGTLSAKQLISDLYPLTQPLLTAMVALNRPGPKKIGAPIEFVKNLQNDRAEKLAKRGITTLDTPKNFESVYSDKETLNAALEILNQEFAAEIGPEQCTKKALKNILLSTPFLTSPEFQTPLKNYHAAYSKDPASPKNTKESYNLILARLNSDDPADFIEEITKIIGILKSNPIFSEITKETSGVIIYQEQIQKIAENLAKMTEREGNALRSSVAKKKDINLHKAAFLKAITSDQPLLEYSGIKIYPKNGNTLTIEYPNRPNKDFQGVIVNGSIVKYEDQGITTEFPDDIKDSVQKINSLILSKEMTVKTIPSEIDSETAHFLWDNIEEFGEYAFNLSHAAAYAQNTYTTQQIKIEQPTEAYTSYLNHVKNLDKVPLIEEIKKVGIKTELQHLTNVSIKNVVKSSADKVIGVSLSNIKGIGERDIGPLRRVMSRNPASFFDMMVEYQTTPKKLVEKLGPLGLFDELSLSESEPFLPFGSADIVSEDFPELFKALSTCITPSVKSKISALYSTVIPENKNQEIIQFFHQNPPSFSKLDYFLEVSENLGAEVDSNDEIQDLEKAEKLEESKQAVITAAQKNGFSVQEIISFCKVAEKYPQEVRNPQFLNTPEITAGKKEIAAALKVNFQQKLNQIRPNFHPQSLSQMEKDTARSALLDISAGLLSPPKVDASGIKEIDYDTLVLPSSVKPVFTRNQSKSKTLILAAHPPKNNFGVTKDFKPQFGKSMNNNYSKDSNESPLIPDRALAEFISKTAPILYVEPMTNDMTKLFKTLIDVVPTISPQGETPPQDIQEQIEAVIKKEIAADKTLDYITKSPEKQRMFIGVLLLNYKKFSEQFSLVGDNVMYNYKKQKKEIIEKVISDGVQHIVLGFTKGQLREYLPLFTKKKNYLESLTAQTVVEKTKSGSTLVLSFPAKLSSNNIAPFHYNFDLVKDVCVESVASYSEAVNFHNSHQPPPNQDPPQGTNVPEKKIIVWQPDPPKAPAPIRS